MALGDRRERGQRGTRRGGNGHWWEGLLITAQQLHSQGDALVPCPREHADESGVERWLKYIFFVDIVVAVAWEDLEIISQEAIKVRYTQRAHHTICNKPNIFCGSNSLSKMYGN